jgi:hypothetical protein
LVPQQQISSQYGINFYGRCSMKIVAIYLLAVRASSKIRAGQKMKERLEAQKVVA